MSFKKLKMIFTHLCRVVDDMNHLHFNGFKGQENRTQ